MATTYKSGDRKLLTLSMDTSYTVLKGEMLEYVTDDVRALDEMADVGLKADNQRAAATAFIGIAVKTSTLGVPSTIPVATAGVFEFDCASATFEVGDLVGPAGTGSGGNVGVSSTTVVAVATADLAIGKVARRGTSVTRISVEIFSKVCGRAGTDASALELTRRSQRSTRVIPVTTTPITVTEADHEGRIFYITKTDGLAITLPAPTAGAQYTFILGATIASASTIKSAAGSQVMIGYACMGNDSNNATVNWPAIAASTYDTIDLLGTSNSTGGLAGQVIRITGLTTTLWYVEITGDAAGTEATPFADTVT